MGFPDYLKIFGILHLRFSDAGLLNFLSFCKSSITDTSGIVFHICHNAVSHLQLWNRHFKLFWCHLQQYLPCFACSLSHFRSKFPDWGRSPCSVIPWTELSITHYHFNIFKRNIKFICHHLGQSNYWTLTHLYLACITSNQAFFGDMKKRIEVIRKCI